MNWLMTLTNLDSDMRRMGSNLAELGSLRPRTIQWCQQRHQNDNSRAIRSKKSLTEVKICNRRRSYSNPGMKEEKVW